MHIGFGTLVVLLLLFGNERCRSAAAACCVLFGLGIIFVGVPVVLLALLGVFK